ncbi:MAG: hypothetical protein SFT81_05460 [Candidatus Caenarcaniphilales bacterium]|nr:hypothetical protein [Candidatus Caenarcaniphilales bacterium]
MYLCVQLPFLCVGSIILLLKLKGFLLQIQITLTQMPFTTSTKTQISALVAEEIEALKLDLVELEFASQSIDNLEDILRITISDQTQHTGHKQCTKVAKALRKRFDEQGLEYQLEIYSPGIGRLLSSEHDFKIFFQKLISLKLNDHSLETGYLIAKDPEKVTIRKNDQSISFPLSQIQEISLAQDSPPEISELSLEDI